MAETFVRKQIASSVPLGFGYNYYVGQYLEKYILALGERKILAVRCPGCGKVVVPPRSTCGRCDREMEEWLEVGPEGTVENFTAAFVRVKDGLVKDLDEPRIIGMIRLDGADSLMDAEIRGVSPGEVKTGLRVKAVWSEKIKGKVTDLSHFEPV
ncbi:MAG: Zn-ribbon domain-containing OB-fold protein [bacterium]